MTTRRLTDRSTRIALGAVVATALVGGVGLAAAAAGDVNRPSASEAAAAPPADREIDEMSDDCEHDEQDGKDRSEDEQAERAEEFAALSAEEQAEIVADERAEAAEFIAALDQAGISYTLVDDPVTGVQWPEFDEEDADAEKALDQAFAAIWAEKFAALSAEEQAEIVADERAEAAEFIAALDQAGISYTLVDDPVTGVQWPKFDEEDDAALEALDELFDDEKDGLDEDDEQERFDDERNENEDDDGGDDRDDEGADEES